MCLLDKKMKKCPKNDFFGNNARSGPWWDPMRTFYGTQSMSIVISTQNGYGKGFNIFNFLKTSTS